MVVIQAFNVHGGYGGERNYGIEWMMKSIGPPDDPKRIEAVAGMLRPALAVGETYGIILEVKDHDPMTGGLVTAASCLLCPPGELEDGSTMKIGSDRYYYGYSTADVTLSFEDKPAQFVQKSLAFESDVQWDEKRKDFGDMWYVAQLGTHIAFQKRGYSRLLLNVVSSFADETQHDCYLECAEQNSLFYEKNGYEIVWKNIISVEGDSSILTICGMARKYPKR